MAVRRCWTPPDPPTLATLIRRAKEGDHNVGYALLEHLETYLGLHASGQPTQIPCELAEYFAQILSTITGGGAAGLRQKRGTLTQCGRSCGTLSIR